MKRIRVLIVEDSAVVLEHLRRIISADPRLEVAGVATSGEEAVALVGRVLPDVISMDIHLPGIQGFEATRRIMAQRPTPIVVVSGIDSDEIGLTMQALKAGALAVVEKPAATTQQDYEAVAARLCTQLAIMSEVKVVRQRENSFRREEAPAFRPPAPAFSPASYKVVGIAASTGGPGALLQLLPSLGEGFALPIVIVQHMTVGFMGGFAEWLGAVTPFPVTIVSAPTQLERGRIYLAPSDWHLTLNGLTASLDQSPAVGNHRPSANVTFSSMARSLGASAIGVLLTGMGEDGATGLCEMRKAGAFTIAEHPSTAIVYGMPAAAVRMGGACESVPAGDIARRILELVATNREAV